MKIGLLTHSVNPRGGVIHTLELARALHELGAEVTVFLPALAGEVLFRPVPFRTELIAVDAVPSDLNTLVVSRMRAFEQHLRALPDRAEFDVWHAHDGIGANALANLLESGLIRDFVRTVHHLDEFEDPRVMQWQRRSYVAAARVLCVSDLWFRTLQSADHVEPKRVKLVNNGVDLDRYQPNTKATDIDTAKRYGLRPGAPMWLSVGGVEARKNTIGSLKAFARFVEQGPHHQFAQLVIVGGASLLNHGAYQAEFREVLQSSQLSDSVVLTGKVPDPEMPAFFRLADGLLMPSLKEGFGLVVLEALASGTPVVVSNRPPFTEYLSDGDAHWADPLDPESIAVAMAEALGRTISEIPAVCQRFSWTKSAQIHYSIYQDLIHHREETCDA